MPAEPHPHAIDTHTHHRARGTTRFHETESGKKRTEAHAQRDAEVSGDPGITASRTTQGSTERKPSADQHEWCIDERCAIHGPNELRTPNPNRRRGHLHLIVVVEGAGGGGAGGDGAGGAEAELEEAKLAEPERGGGAVAEAELWRRRSWR